MNTGHPDKSPLWAEIDTAALAANCRAAARLIPEETGFMAVVKADGYGHGALPTARAALENGATYLGVARPEEGIALRSFGIRVPILILCSAPPEYAEQILEHDLIQTVVDLESAEAMGNRALALGGKMRVHLKADTGMGRLGTLAVPGESDEGSCRLQALEEGQRIASQPGLQLEGVFTHLARADSSDLAYTRLQLQRFLDLTCGLQQRGVHVGLRHAANSAATVQVPESHLDMVRPGLMLYGLNPLEDPLPHQVELEPVMSLKARVCQTKDVEAGFCVSYGSTYKTERSTRLAVLPVGYADGYRRCLSPGAEVLIRGRRARVAGRICMDQTVVDLGPDCGARAGEEAVLLGRQGKDQIPASEIAGLCGTITYEIVSGVATRVPRIFLD